MRVKDLGVSVPPSHTATPPPDRALEFRVQGQSFKVDGSRFKGTGLGVKGRGFGRIGVRDSGVWFRFSHRPQLPLDYDLRFEA